MKNMNFIITILTAHIPSAASFKAESTIWRAHQQESDQLHEDVSDVHGRTLFFHSEICTCRAALIAYIRMW